MESIIFFRHHYGLIDHRASSEVKCRIMLKPWAEPQQNIQPALRWEHPTPAEAERAQSSAQLCQHHNQLWLVFSRQMPPHYAYGLVWCCKECHRKRMWHIIWCFYAYKWVFTVLLCPSLTSYPLMSRTNLKYWTVTFYIYLVTIKASKQTADINSRITHTHTHTDPSYWEECTQRIMD